ncbi:MAG: hypothetical protein EOO74_08640 [Myxococcales bacterium]|nr:MAG: hypothetical protein EOO74_08640 [Myxococcales bacterium]
MLAVLLSVVLAGCASGPLAEDKPSDATKPPTLGACRTLSPGDVEKSVDDSEEVSCARKHTAETFLVSSLPAATGTKYAARAHGAHVHRTCSVAFQKFIGADESLAMRTRLSWAWFRASEKGWAKGARWFRCDVVGGQAQDKAFRPLPKTAKGLLSKEEVSAWMTCAKGPVLAQAPRVFCDKPHDWRAVTAIKIGRPDDPYPGDRVSEVRARDGCSDWVGAWMNYPVDYDYAYSTFHEAEWKAGNRRAVCWARTDQ